MNYKIIIELQNAWSNSTDAVCIITEQNKYLYMQELIESYGQGSM